MCTLTWTSDASGTFVAFSRDELETRAPGLAPRVVERAGVKLIAPIDGEAGGTWIVASELGLTLALLNGYRFQDPGALETEPAGRWRSRGELPLFCGDAASLEAVGERLASLDLARHRPFELVAFDARGRARAWAWTGSALSSRELTSGDRPLVSSSFDDAGAREQRRIEFARVVGSGGGARELEAFHASHEPRRGAYSPCMHRDDAHTVSFTRVRVGPERVVVEVQPGAPCEGRPPDRVEIPRRSPARAARPVPELR